MLHAICKRMAIEMGLVRAIADRGGSPVFGKELSAGTRFDQRVIGRLVKDNMKLMLTVTVSYRTSSPTPCEIAPHLRGGKQRVQSHRDDKAPEYPGEHRVGQSLVRLWPFVLQNDTFLLSPRIQLRFHIPNRRQHCQLYRPDWSTSVPRKWGERAIRICIRGSIL